MSDELEALLLERAALTLEELAAGCCVEGLMGRRPGTGRRAARQSANRSRAVELQRRDLLRLRRIRALERDFDANPELAALVADLVEELDRLRTRLSRAGLATD
ncbi:MAG: MerR family transcriptional regulator [Gammaproteobacteria bacterium]|nr:MerR family transcriptional regulator [Gammaproteobacteria bacterium]